MHRNMRRIGDQFALVIKYSAGKIQPLFNVHTAGGLLQHQPHLFGHRHKQMIKNFQLHRVGSGVFYACIGVRNGAGRFGYLALLGEQ